MPYLATPSHCRLIGGVIVGRLQLVARVDGPIMRQDLEKPEKDRFATELRTVLSSKCTPGTCRSSLALSSASLDAKTAASFRMADTTHS